MAKKKLSDCASEAPVWGSPVEREIKRRIQVAVWAYAYEFMSDSLVSDHKFDQTCLEIDLSIKTGNKEMDQWFEENFDPSTGQWIWRHPNIMGIERIYRMLRPVGTAAFDGEKTTE